MRASARPYVLAAAATALIVAARFFPLPAVHDAVSGAAIPGVHLELTGGYVALGPLSAAADFLTCSSLGGAAGVLLLMLLLLPAFRWGVLAHGAEEWLDVSASARALAAYAAVCAAFLLFAVLAPRPMARLAVDDRDVLAVDFHSHTSESWDGRRRFTPEQNRRWHERAGYGAAFATDHNKLTRAPGLLSGEEVSLHEAHVVVLAPGARIDPDAVQGMDGLRAVLADARAGKTGPAIMSLPEYWKHHWAELDQLADWGAGGFELVTASPKALDFPAGKARALVDFCRRRNLFLAAASDNHGYGRAACAWNVVRLPGWRAMSPGALEAALIARLRAEGFKAVTVATRARPRGEGLAPWTDGPVAAWNEARSWPLPLAGACVAWCWLLAVAASAGIGNKVR